MLLVNEYNLQTAEDLLELLDKVRNLNMKIWEEASKRYQFNLSLERTDAEIKLKNFLGKNVYIANANNTDNFCYKPAFLIKRDMYELFQNMVKSNVILEHKKLNLLFTKDFNPIFYNSKSIYGSIDLKTKTDHLKVKVEYDNIVSEIPPIGLAIDGLPFFEDEINNEAQTSGFWIEGTSVKFFINTFKNGEVPNNFKLKVYYYKG